MTAISKGTSFSISSDFIESSALFSGDNSLIVYVEGFEDIPFWKRILDDKLKIKVIAYGEYEKANGKGTITSAINKGEIILGRSLIVALDSDYDNLLGNNADIFAKETVLQTYSYSIENLIWHPNNIDYACQIASCDHQNFIDDALKKSIIDWSICIYPAFIKFLYDGADNEQLFNEIITSMEVDIKNFIVKFSGTQINFENSDFIAKMSEKGLNPETAFLFIRGHDYADKLQEICRALNNEAFERRKANIQNSANGKKKGNLISEAKNVQKEPGAILAGLPIRCDICIPKIERDIEKLIQYRE
ncbi:DUF4435 domain-containing protein [Aeromonas veronii]|uniref:DUF4435 domain-containing protein n=1 Tax=Aeromonas veronii TaxID=654 RepID=UPI001F248F50|nr:DUF4435 domain-containing protein [Aeromonas veronii]MCF5844681.1 DUF4435 domain-containing protein [Aeromonas veronii]